MRPWRERRLLKYTVEGIPDVEGNINIGGVGVKQS